MYINKTLQKFNENKSYKFFPGNSIIKIISDEKLLNLIKKVKNEMESSNLFDKYIFLPEDSYHVTICDLLTYEDLKTNLSYKNFGINKDEDINFIDKRIIEELSNINFNLKVRMRVKNIKPKRLSLEPKTIEDYNILNEFRKKVYSKLNLVMNESYKFHCSLSYQLQELSNEEELIINNFMQELNDKYLNEFDDIEINVATLVAFNDMSEFRELSLGRKNLGFYSI